MHSGSATWRKNVNMVVMSFHDNNSWKDKMRFVNFNWERDFWKNHSKLLNINAIEWKINRWISRDNVLTLREVYYCNDRASGEGGHHYSSHYLSEKGLLVKAKDFLNLLRKLIYYYFIWDNKYLLKKNLDVSKRPQIILNLYL